MTLSKILTIKNVGRFQNYGATGDVLLKRFNLIFAENGRGKSTLCAILRSVQTNDPAHILGRTTLGSSDAPYVQFLTSSGNVIFKTGVWTQPMPHLAIFDSTFVAENVFSGDTVDLDHKRNLYRVIIGKSGVALAQEVDDLDAQIRGTNSSLKIKRANVEGRVPPGIGFDPFVALQADPQIEMKITEKERELEAVQQSAQLKARAGLSEVVVPELPTGLTDILQRTVAGLSATVEQRIATHIVKHQMQGTGEAWLQRGLSYVQDDSCPFCDQSLKDVELIPSLSLFFGRAYEELKAAIAALKMQIETDFSDRSIAAAETVLAGNTSSVEFWSRYCKVIAPSLSSPQGFGRSLRELRDAAIALLDKKTAAPLENIWLDQRFNTATNVVAALLSSAAEYNRAVLKADAIIQAKKASLEGANEDRVRSELGRLKATKSRHTPEAVKACNEHAAAVRQKEQLERDKEAVRQKLDEHTKTIIGTYEKTINKLLADFQAGFRITGTKHAYPGGVPSSTFQILINDTAIPLGDEKTPLSSPSFKNTLSAGDKSTLALAFFIAQLEHDVDRATRIVVFDDPFNSQDAFRKEHTVQKIRKCGETSLQVIVFSHDRNFLRRLNDHLNQRSLETKCLTLARMGEKLSKIVPWDIDGATQTNHHANLTALASFYNANEGKPIDISAKMRTVIETHCRMMYPSLFDKDEQLGGICGKVRGLDASHELAAFYDDLDSINEYSRDHHHGEKPGVPQTFIDEVELQGYVEKTLTFVGYC